MNGDLTLLFAEQAALRTEPTKEQYRAAYARLDGYKEMRILHCLMGFCTEAGEAMDAMKKYVFYGKPLDLVNLSEENGDLTWYARILAHALHGDHGFEQTLSVNVSKLRARFNDRFTELEAIVRDLSAERKILEGHTSEGPNE